MSVSSGMSSPVEMSLREVPKAFNFSLERDGTSTRAPCCKNIRVIRSPISPAPPATTTSLFPKSCWFCFTTSSSCILFHARQFAPRSLSSRMAPNLELRPSSVDWKLCSRREGCINRQECHRLGNLLRLAETLHRNAFRHLKVDLIYRLLRHSNLMEYGRRSNWTGGHRINTYSTGQKCSSNAPSKSTKRCFGGAIGAQVWHPLHVGNRSGKDHRTSFRHERRQFLDDEIRSLGVQVEDVVVNFLAHRLKRDKFTISRVDEQHIELAECLLDLRR